MQTHNNALRPHVGADSEQTITPAYSGGESMTFNTQSSREQYIRQQRAYGWEVFLNFQGKDSTGTELYAITRRAL